MEPDHIDLKIIEVLKRDARASMTTLAESVFISRASAHARFKRLVAEGVISAFTVRTDPVLAGKHSSAYVTLSVDQADWQDARDRLLEIPEVEHIALVGGEYDVMLLVRARDNRDLRRVVLERIQSIPSVRGTRTLLIFEDFPNIAPLESGSQSAQD
ncbi:AsnC family transcriptional regulator [Leucobacter sp. Psy1]|uniref:Lrp/AsnC family transcriptional regulator n=1 Tax=Leucobacter sp. Psy1 TaxID=2875729 RepID=UPI001CD77A13|nr:Lrp/AsnC family transcriptional regulator [Leucobacter sp. Psy1]UBH07323.1 AsnC family transcriptional regulator [Leucobacter sp. Psy1]